MLHGHTIIDTDKHFIIDPITRAVTNAEQKKTLLMQNDHNSECFSFEIDRFVEGHDMMLCNRVEVHYSNVDTNKRNSSLGVYEVTDLTLSSDETKVTFTWIVSQNATLYSGSLNFLIMFACVENGENVYRWNSAINNSIAIAKGMYNGEAVLEPYPDVLLQWKEELFAAVYGYKVMAIGPSAPDSTPYIWFNTSAYGDTGLGLITVKDINGNIYSLYPVTKMDAVEGLNEALAAINEGLDSTNMSMSELMQSVSEELQSINDVLNNLAETIKPEDIGAATAEHTHADYETMLAEHDTYLDTNDIDEHFWIRLSRGSSQTAGASLLIGEVLDGEQQNFRVRLGHTQNGPYLSFRNSDSSRALEVGENGDGGKMIMFDKNGNGRCKLYYDPNDDKEKLIFYDAEGNKLVKYGTDIHKSNLSVDTTAFVADTTYADYPYRASIEISGVTTEMLPDVVFSLADATSGILAPIAEAYNGGIYIYANAVPEAVVTIVSLYLKEVY